MNVAVSLQVFLHIKMYEDNFRQYLEEVQSCTFPDEAQTLGHRGMAGNIHKLKCRMNFVKKMLSFRSHQLKNHESSCAGMRTGIKQDYRMTLTPGKKANMSFQGHQMSAL